MHTCSVLLHLVCSYIIKDAGSLQTWVTMAGLSLYWYTCMVIRDGTNLFTHLIQRYAGSLQTWVTMAGLSLYWYACIVIRDGTNLVTHLIQMYAGSLQLAGLLINFQLF